MSEYLVVRLGINFSDVISWLVWSPAESEVISSGEIASAAELEQLNERAGERKVIVLVPASEVCIHNVMLPEKVSRQTLAALPYLMEEDIADDIERLHYVPMHKKPKASEVLPVLVVSDARMAQWLDWLSEANLHADKMLPDALCLPTDEDSASAMQLQSTVLLRHGKTEILNIEAAWSEIAFKALEKEEITELVCFNDLDIDVPDSINCEFKHVELPMGTLAAEAVVCTHNMLINDYKPAKRGAGKFFIWRMAAVLAAAAILLNLTDKGLELWQLSAQNDALKASINQTYRSAFPNEKRLTNVRVQLKNKLRMLEGGGSSDMLLSMLDELVPAFRNSTGIKPINLKFDAKRAEIRLQAVSSSFQDFEKFKEAIQELNMDVEQGALSQQDDEVVGTLSIRRAS